MQDVETREEAVHSIVAGGKSLLDGREGAGVPGGAERFRGAARGNRSNDVGLGGGGVGEEGAKKRGGEFRHVASEDQAPAGSMAQGSLDPAEGAAAGVGLFEAGQIQMRVAFGRSDEGDGAGGFAGLGGDPFDEGGAAERQEGLVASHADAAATGENVRLARHETILPAAEGMKGFGMRDIAVSGRCPWGYNRKNKSMRICLIAMLLLTAGGRVQAEPAGRVSTTVRADSRTGRLVRSTVVAPMQVASRQVAPRVLEAREVPAEGGKAAARTSDFDGIVEEAARTHSVDPLLVHSVIRVESNYNPVAVSPKGAAGLMQLIPETARRFGASNRFDVRENITAGVKYLKYLQEMFKDDRLALAAYNAGEGAVQRYRDIPPYRETEDYVLKVGQHYGAARKQQQKKETAAKAAAEPAAAGPKTEPLRQLDVATDAEGRVILRTR